MSQTRNKAQQAQQAQQEQQELTTAIKAQLEQDNAISTLFSKVSLDGLGFTATAMERTEDGMTMLHNADSVGTDVYAEIQQTDEEYKAMQALDIIRRTKGAVSILTCEACAQLADSAKKAGFKSIGAFVAGQMPDYEANTVNKYVRVYKYFLDTDKDGHVDYKRSWLKGVQVSKLSQVLALVEKCDGDIDKFRAEYIVTGKLSLSSSLSDIKKQMQAIAGTNKDKDKDKDKAGAGTGAGAGTEDISTKWAAVCEYLAKETDAVKAGKLKACMDYISQYIEEPQEQEQEQEQEQTQA